MQNKLPNDLLRRVQHVLRISAQYYGEVEIIELLLNDIAQVEKLFDQERRELTSEISHWQCEADDTQGELREAEYKLNKIRDIVVS